ncbi:MAG TPA: Gfo/Idh/MocA family oxidoreductase, partial [Tepidisphaeraceae bacterium]|nr:Gfo/Idh/MocA family oxidoreductase [Tepidisphaeraceae bacterium]
MNKGTSSRREFVAAGVGIAAAALLTPHVRGDEPAAGKKLGFCFVGIGNLCMNQLLPEIHESKHAKPVALVSGHPDKAKQQAEKHGVDPKHIYNYDNFDSIKDNPEIDVVYIVLPNSMHAEYTIRAAKAGKHVLCEKPMANSPEDCRKMIDACKQAGKLLQIGYRLHFEPNTQ